MIVIFIPAMKLPDRQFVRLSYYDEVIIFLIDEYVIFSVDGWSDAVGVWVVVMDSHSIIYNWSQQRMVKRVFI